MAKGVTAKRVAGGGTIVIAAPQSPARRRVSALARAAGAKARHYGKRAGTAVAKKAWERRSLFSGVVVGYALGYVQRENINIPSFGPLGKNGTIAAALIGASFLMRNEYLSHAATAAAAVAAYDYGSTGSVHGVGGPYDHMHSAIDQGR